MTISMRLLVATLLLAPALASAQTTTTIIGVPPSLQVQRLGPQLVTFVGGQANFDNLVNGLAAGTPVTLTTVLPNGQVQVVTFTPQGTLTPIQIAQTLETARQSLISRGVAAPTSQQVAITLTGGTLPTQTGNVQVTGLLPTTTNLPAGTAAAGGTNTTVTTPNPNGTPSPSALIQGQSGAGGTTPPSPSQLIQNQRDGNTSNTPNAGTTPGTTTGTTTAPASVAAPVAPAPAASGSPSSASVR